MAREGTICAPPNVLRTYPLVSGALEGVRGRCGVRHVTGFGMAVLAALTLALVSCSDDGGFDGSDEDAATTSASSVRATADYAVEEGEAYGGGEGASSASVLGRTIIRNGYVSLEVESVGRAFEAAQALAATHGGYVADSSFSGDLGNRDDDDEERFTYANLTLRIPADRYDRVVADLRALALRVLSVSTNTQDITGEVTDLESDLRNLRAVEAQYLELLGHATEVGDVVLVHDRLTQTRGQIERIQGSLALLQSLADLSTLHVDLQSQPPDEGADGGSLLDAARDGWEASLATLNVIARAGLAVIAFSWWLVPIVVVVLAVLYRRGLLTRRGR